jgi:aspartyl-tRNA(Asn)/glutamyl-tRNA(Gln) amidotransferase subunit B
MRIKSNEVDYHYFPEPNINCIDISSLISQTTCPRLPSQIKQDLLAKQIPQDIVEQLVNNFEAYKAFIYINSKVNNLKSIITWLLIELPPFLKQDNKAFSDIQLSFLDNIVELISLIEKNVINGKQAKVVFEKMYTTNKLPSLLIDELGFKQIIDENLIKNTLQKIIDSNKTMLDQYESRPERIEKMFIGLLMKETKGQANPVIATKILRNLIKK